MREEQRDLWCDSRTNKRARSSVKEGCGNGNVRDSSFEAEKPSCAGADVQTDSSNQSHEEEVRGIGSGACTHCEEEGGGTWKKSTDTEPRDSETAERKLHGY